MAVTVVRTMDLGIEQCFLVVLFPVSHVNLKDPIRLHVRARVPQITYCK